jgi:hypothetical protein
MAISNRNIVNLIIISSENEFKSLILLKMIRFIHAYSV